MTEQQISNRINAICHFNAFASFPVAMRPTAFAVLAFLELVLKPTQPKDIRPICYNKHDTTIRHCLNELESVGLVRNVSTSYLGNHRRPMYVITEEGRQYLSHYDVSYARTQDKIAEVIKETLA